MTNAELWAGLNKLYAFDKSPDEDFHLVRCKDCKHNIMKETFKRSDLPRHKCKATSGAYLLYVPDFFCADGDRGPEND